MGQSTKRKSRKPKKAREVKVKMTEEDHATLVATVVAILRLELGPFMLSATFEKLRRDGLLDE